MYVKMASLNQSICRLYGFLQAPRYMSLVQRNVGCSAVVFNKMDPVQKIFVDTIAQYKSLSEKQGGGAVDAGPEYEQRKQDAITRLGKVYNVHDPLKFPDFQFNEPDLNQDEV